MFVSGYTVHLYCEHPEHKNSWDNQQIQNEFAGPNKTDCVKQARGKGWRCSNHNKVVICPSCRKKRITNSPAAAKD